MSYLNSVHVLELKDELTNCERVVNTTLKHYSSTWAQSIWSYFTSYLISSHFISVNFLLIWFFFNCLISLVIPFVPSLATGIEEDNISSSFGSTEADVLPLLHDITFLKKKKTRTGGSPVVCACLILKALNEWKSLILVCHSTCKSLWRSN